MPIPTDVIDVSSYEVIDPIGVAPPGEPFGRYVEEDTTQIPLGSQVLDVYFVTEKASPEYLFDEKIVRNVVDDPPFVAAFTITDQRTDGFQVTFNFIPDTGNYYFKWKVRIPTTLVSGVTISATTVGTGDGTVKGVSATATDGIKASVTNASQFPNISLSLIDGGVPISKLSETVVTGDVLRPSAAQTVTNKDISGQNNSIHDLPISAIAGAAQSTLVLTDPQADRVPYWDNANKTFAWTFKQSFFPEDYGAKGDGTTSDTTAIQSAINAAQAVAGRVVLRNATYKLTDELLVSSPVAIEGTHVAAIYGNSVSNSEGEVPLLSPYLSGSVLLQTVAGKNGIRITAVMTTVNLKNFGIRFADAIKWSNTGHGVWVDPPITSGSAQDYGLFEPRWDGVYVYGHDGNHYGFKLDNIINGNFTHLRTYGGGGIEISANGLFSGNSTFNSPYVALHIGGTANGFNLINANGGPLNLITFLRPQCNLLGNPGSTPPLTTQYNFYAQDGIRYLTAIDADMEIAVANPTTYGGVRLPSNFSGNYWTAVNANGVNVPGDALIGSGLKTFGHIKTTSDTGGIYIEDRTDATIEWTWYAYANQLRLVNNQLGNLWFVDLDGTLHIGSVNCGVLTSILNTNSFTSNVILQNTSTGTAAITGVEFRNHAGALRGVIQFLDSNYDDPVLANSIHIGSSAGTNVPVKIAYNGQEKLALTSDLTFTDAVNVAFNSGTGTKLGTDPAQKLAFHNATPVIQRAGAAQAAVATTAATNSSPYGYSQAQADGIVALLNEVRAVLVEKGLMKGSA